MKILFVAFPFSIHTARWISQLEGQGWEVHLFSSAPGHDMHESIRGIHYHENFFDRTGKDRPGNRYRSVSLRWLSGFKSPLVRKIIRKSYYTAGKVSREDLLEKVIRKVKPDVIHTLETQHAAYMTGEVKKRMPGSFPLWIHSTWGIDLHYFGQLEKHVPLIRRTMQDIDFLITEGDRDLRLAKQFGFEGKHYVFTSVGGGFQLPQEKLKPPSTRMKILVKGTQDMVRRGLVALRAIERCADMLDGFEIVLYSSNETTRAAAEQFYAHTGKKITIYNESSHGDFITFMKEARINICINMSDGMPNSMLESMMMGVFPIQSDTSMANEVLRHGITAMIVPPEDPELIEQAIRKALSDDALVDSAAVVNMNYVSANLNADMIREQVISMYHSAAAMRGISKAHV